jgi:hypothetical protein
MQRGKLGVVYAVPVEELKNEKWGSQFSWNPQRRQQRWRYNQLSIDKAESLSSAQKTAKIELESLMLKNLHC